MVVFLALVLLCCWVRSVSALELPKQIQGLWERVECVGGEYDQNDIGVWFWIPGGQHVGQTLIVIGGDDYREVVTLLQEGYMVWVRSIRCRDVRPKLNPQVCREYFGYFDYLSDNDPRKPFPPIVAFLHGHQHSWHQRHGWDSLKLAITCSSIKNRFTPIVRLEWETTDKNYTNYRQYITTEKLPKYILKTSKTNIGYVAFWNKKFGNIRTIKSRLLGGWCCGQYVIPRDVILKNPFEFYAQLSSLFRTGRGGFSGSFNGYFLEYAFHLFFGEPSNIDPYTQPACLADDTQPMFFLNHSIVLDHKYNLFGDD